MDAEEQERRRQFDARRLEFLRQIKVQEEMNRATEIRQRKLEESEAEMASFLKSRSRSVRNLS
jgi:membrane protein involved in colicin uptake